VEINRVRYLKLGNDYECVRIVEGHDILHVIVGKYQTEKKEAEDVLGVEKSSTELHVDDVVKQSTLNNTLYISKKK